MKRIFVVSIMLCLGCSQIQKDKEISLVVNNFRKDANPTKPPPIPLDPFGYYGCFNFIFDTTGNIYYYQHFYDPNIKPKTVIDYDSNEPIFVNLTPDQIVIISEDDIKRFVEDNVLTADKVYRTIRIIGVEDTIKSKALSPLMHLLNDTSNHIDYLVRKSTYEENIVLGYKRNQKFYNPLNVNWDSTKIWFYKRNSGT